MPLCIKVMVLSLIDSLFFNVPSAHKQAEPSEGVGCRQTIMVLIKLEPINLLPGRFRMICQKKLLFYHMNLKIGHDKTGVIVLVYFLQIILAL